MLHKHALMYIDRTLQDIRGNVNLFGNAVVLIGGDWKQLAPVVSKAGRMQVILKSKEDPKKDLIGFCYKDEFLSF